MTLGNWPIDDTVSGVQEMPLWSDRHREKNLTLFLTIALDRPSKIWKRMTKDHLILAYQLG